ncbi:MAG: hypothetical protein KDH96_02230 [Candidatus Riesia sp.]|nr:hypothetical protein [Candidatus Riesia sp.]
MSSEIKRFTTVIQAIKPSTNCLTKWSGDIIEADSIEEAQSILDNTGRGYMKADAELIEEIPLSNEEWINVINNM